MVATILGLSMRPLFEYVASRGLDPNELVGHFGVELARFEDPQAWIPVSLTDRIWEHAATLCNDPKPRPARDGCGSRVFVNAQIAAM